jgi:predicted  nucleic acid-binding Zn-ribbon protein
MSGRDEYVEKMKQQLDEWNAELDNLEAKVQDVGEDLKAKYEVKIKEVREKRAKGEEKLREIIDSGEDAWEGLKGEAERAWTAFKDGVKTVRSHYQKESEGSES